MKDVVELAEWEPKVECFGNVARRRLTFIGKQVLPAHQHNFAHAHVVMRGTIRCTLLEPSLADNGDGPPVMVYFWKPLSVTDYPAGSMFEVPAHLGHQLESITDEGAEGWCLFAVRDEDGGVTYEVTDKHKKDHFWNERLGGGDQG